MAIASINRIPPQPIALNWRRLSRRIEIVLGCIGCIAIINPPLHYEDFFKLNVTCILFQFVTFRITSNTLHCSLPIGQLQNSEEAEIEFCSNLEVIKLFLPTSKDLMNDSPNIGTCHFKGRLRKPIWMNFGKFSKIGEWGGHPQSKT